MVTVLRPVGGGGVGALGLPYFMSYNVIIFLLKFFILILKSLLNNLILNLTIY